MAIDIPSVGPQSGAWLELADVQRLLLGAWPGVALALDARGRIRWLNPAAEERLGYGRDELQGAALAEALIPLEEIEVRAAQLSAELGERVPADMSVLGAALRRDGDAAPPEPHEWVLRHKNGSPQRTRLAVCALRDPQGNAVGLIAVEPLAHPDDAPLKLTHHDSLTGLPTRAVLQDRAEMALLRAARHKSVLALMLIEIVGFDALCERHGHTVGDDVLRAIAGRLHFELRKTDTAVRLERGQFAAMLVDLHRPDEAQRVAEKIAKSLSAPINVGVARLEITARLGVVWAPSHGNQLLPLLQAAEALLLNAPADQGGVHCGPVEAG
ncbi:MAG: GGDEF domain-containing protein [Burkholderiaceae bacterium]